MGLSSRRLGEIIGLTSEQTNTLLMEAGFQSGQPGDYIVTEKGKKYVEEKSWDNGYGGYAARGYSYNEWDESILDELNTKPENLEYIRDLTAERRRKRKEEGKHGNSDNNYISNEIENDKDNNNDLVYIIVGIIGYAIIKIEKMIYNKIKFRKK